MDIFQEANCLIDRIAIVQNHRWDSLLSFRLCDLGDENKWMAHGPNQPEYVPCLDVNKFSSVGDAAEALEQMVLCGQQDDTLDAAQTKGICIVCSKRTGAY